MLFLERNDSMTTNKTHSTLPDDPLTRLLQAVEQVLPSLTTPAFQQLEHAVQEARVHLEADVLTHPWTPFVLDAGDPSGIQVYRNSRYQVHVRRYPARDGSAPLLHLSLKRLDQRPHVPYRELMRIKDALVDTEAEAVFLLPARSREVDLANQTHLWLIASPGFRFPFGFEDGRLVSDISLAGSVQEPWPQGERPEDCLSLEQVRALFEAAQGGSDA
jgi:hypothetical protein